jgi:hypothetical protein
MKNLELFITALQTMFYSWGGDPAPEVYWAGSDYLIWIKKEFDIELESDFDEMNPESIGIVIAELREKL